MTKKVPETKIAEIMSKIPTVINTLSISQLAILTFHKICVHALLFVSRSILCILAKWRILKFY